jgi:hypothetical protein
MTTGFAPTSPLKPRLSAANAVAIGSDIYPGDNAVPSARPVSLAAGIGENFPNSSAKDDLTKSFAKKMVTAQDVKEDPNLVASFFQNLLEKGTR